MAAVQQLELSPEVAARENEGPGFMSHSVHLMDLFLANPLFLGHDENYKVTGNCVTLIYR